MTHISLHTNIERLRNDLRGTKLLVVTKKRSVREIREVIACGVKDIGENTLQEIQKKFDNNLFRELQKNGVRLHYIGHLQTNKIRKIVRLCDVIQSVDTLEKAEKVSQAAADLKKTMPIFLELNVTGEEQKHGIILFESEDGSPHSSVHLREMISQIQKLSNVRLLGFMCIGKHDDLEETRKVFKKCNQLAQEFGLPEVSMGMSEDYPVALEEGSTMVRVGRIIFE